MADSTSWRLLDDAARAAAVGRWIATEREAAWLDGGRDAASVAGVEPDLVVEGDDAGAIAAVDRAWRRDSSALWIGCVTYDFAADLLLGRTPLARAVPGVGFRRYPSWLRYGPGDLAEVHGDVPPPRAGTVVADDATLGTLEPLWTPDDYRARVAAALQHVAAGDTYQVNLAQRFFAPWQRPCPASRLAERAVALYSRMRARAPAERGALLRHGAGFVLSNSPETLVDVSFDADGRHVARARPIKGTRPRGTTPAVDAAAAAELRASAKDRAEHVMIVDLVRNDLGRIALPGTVHAPATPDALTLPTVHHLVTEITATLRPGVGLVELFAALVPGGSVTGAPKRRTIEIIEALEGAPRGIYCGAIVMLVPEGLRMSIPIRTGMLDTRGLHLHAGGGIVIDSDPEAERAESFAKTRAFAG